MTEWAAPREPGRCETWRASGDAWGCRRWTLPLLAALCWCGSHGRAPAEDVQPLTSWTTGTSGPDRNVSGSDRLLIFSVGMEHSSDRTISSVTFGGRTMTPIVTAVTGSGSSAYARAYLFYLDEAGLQAAYHNYFSVNWSGSPSETRYAARIYGNVDQDSPIRDFKQASSPNSSPNPITTAGLTVEAGDYAVAAAQCGNPNSYYWHNGFSEGTDQQDDSSAHSTADRLASGAGSLVPSAQNSNPNRQILLGAVLRSMVSTPTLYYVRTDGSNSNSGKGPTPGNAWRTIDHALSNSPVGPSDIVYVMSGTYYEEIRPNEDGSSGSPIQVIADTDGAIFGGGGGAVIVQAPGGGQALDASGDDHMEFTGFTLVGNGSDDVVAIDDSTGLKLIRCEIRNGGNMGVSVEGGSSDVTLVNCLIRDNESDGVHVYSGNVTIINSTIVANEADGIEQDSGTVTIGNSIIAYNDADGLDRNGGAMTHAYNLVYGNNDRDFEGTSQSTGESTSNPRFINAGGNDYRLAGDSPAINAGYAVTGIVEDDLDGNARPVGAGWDLGCYEYLLLGSWQFNDGGGFTAVDESGNGNDADLQGGVAWEARRCAYAVKLDGSSGWIDLGQIDLGTKAYTFSAWFKTSVSSPQTIVAATADGTGNHLMLVELDSAGHVRFVHRDPPASSGGATLSSAQTYRDGAWHCVAAVKSPSELRLYVDGELVDQTSNTGAVHSAVELALGRESVSSGQRYFAGLLDEVRLYGTDLSPSEVGELMGLVGRWRLDEATGSAAYDSSLYAHHGALVGTTFDSSGVSPAKIDDALQFDGGNDYVWIANTSDLQITEALTISAWIKGDSWGSGSDVDVILRKGEGNPNNYQLAVADGRLSLSLDGNDGNGFEADTVLSTGVWHHVAGTWDGAEVRLYVDGVMDHASPFSRSAPIGTDNRTLYLGGRSGADQFDGTLDDVRLYRRALCPDEIESLGHGGSSPGVRVLHWVEVK